MASEFQYIEENLNKILQNPDRVLYIRPWDVDYGEALFAVVREDRGVYKNIQITEKQSKMVFPWTPIDNFKKGPGYVLKGFRKFGINILLNSNHLDEFTYQIANDIRSFNVGIFAVFDDGSATFVEAEKEKYFVKNFGGIQPYMNLLNTGSLYEDYLPKHETYKVIEYRKAVDNTFIIPELQKKEEETKVKKLTNNGNKQV